MILFILLNTTIKDNPVVQVLSDQPIWTRKPNVIKQQEYDKFYKSIAKDKDGLKTQPHVVAEGEMTFKSLLIIPDSQSTEQFDKSGQVYENIKLHIRRVFTTDDFKDMMPSYLSFVKSNVDSDDHPFNASKQTVLPQRNMVWGTPIADTGAQCFIISNIKGFFDNETEKVVETKTMVYVIERTILETSGCIPEAFPKVGPFLTNDDDALTEGASAINPDPSGLMPDGT
jgi:HSP90 family molecular chaperone